MDLSKINKFDIPYNPWFYIPFILIGNFLLSYFHLSVTSQLWIAVTCLLLPLVLALSSCPPAARGESMVPVEFLPTFPIGVMVVIGLLAIFIRFYKLTNLSGWPLIDEGYFGFAALELSEERKWSLFYLPFQSPPLFPWSLGLFFKILGPSLTSLWLFPACLSFLLILLYFWACKLFFNRSFAWIGGSLFALSFWPFYLGRYSVPPLFLVFWELLVFISLGGFLKSLSGYGQNKKAALLGVLTGVGFYAYLSWPFMVLLIFLTVAMALRGSSFKFSTLFWFLIPLILSATPFLVAAFYQRLGTYFSMLWAFQAHHDWQSQTKICWNYFCSIFWGVETNRHGYKPFWGGYLNPLLDSFFFLGLVELYRFRNTAMGLLLGFGLVLFILPGWLTMELEFFRLVLIIPLLLAVIMMGMSVLALKLSPSVRLGAILGILAISTGLDFYHLLGPYQQSCHSDYLTFNADTRSYERMKAYDILREKAQNKGPGLIFTSFESSSFNQTLTLATYPFNAAWNPRLSPTNSTWIGFLTNINYAPFLARRFPEIQWFQTIPENYRSQEILILGILDMNHPEIRAILGHWMEFERAMRPLVWETVNLGFGKSHQHILDSMARLQTLANSDPFLKSCLAEKIFFNAMVDSKPALGLEALRQALTMGYPAAHLFNDLGVFWFTQGDYAKARQAFESALRSPLNHTNALENLRKTPG